MLGFLGYLSRERDASLAVGKILSHVPVAERPRLKTLIENSVAVYKSGSDSTDDAVREDLRSAEGASFPPWLVEEFRCCLHPNWLLDALCNGLFVLQCQVEERAAPSSHLVARPLIEKTLEVSLGSCSGATFPAVHKLFTREGGTSKAVPIECRQSIFDNDGAAAADLASLRDWQVERRRDILLKVAELSTQNQPPLPEGLEILCISMHFWSKAVKCISQTVLKSVVLSLLILLGQGGGICDLAAFQEIARRIESLTPESKEKFQDRCKRFLKTNTNMKRCTMTVVYSLANLQAVVYHASVLSRLLKTEWQEFKAADMWNGTLIYNIHHDLECYTDLDNRCEAILHFDEVLVSVFHHLLDIFRPFINHGSLLPKAGSRNEKRVKKKKPKLTLQEMGNKFELLSISDE